MKGITRWSRLGDMYKTLKPMVVIQWNSGNPRKTEGNKVRENNILELVAATWVGLNLPNCTNMQVWIEAFGWNSFEKSLHKLKVGLVRVDPQPNLNQRRTLL